MQTAHVVDLISKIFLAENNSKLNCFVVSLKGYLCV